MSVTAFLFDREGVPQQAEFPAHESNVRQYQNEMGRLPQEAQQLRLQRNTLIPQLSSDRQLPEMKDFVNHWEITGDINAFPDKEFSNLVEKCEILTGKSMVIHFNCGLTVTESLMEKTGRFADSADHPGSTDQPAESSDKPADILDSCQKAIEHFNEAIECVLTEMQEDIGCVMISGTGFLTDIGWKMGKLSSIPKKQSG